MILNYSAINVGTVKTAIEVYVIMYASTKRGEEKKKPIKTRRELYVINSCEERLGEVEGKRL